MGARGMLKRLICIVLLVFVTFGVSVNASATDRFKWITSSDKETISYDTQTVRYYSDNGKKVDVWVLWKYTEDGAREWVNESRQNGTCKESKWDGFSYTKQHILLNSNYQMNLLYMIYYDSNGNVLNSEGSIKNKWFPLVPDSFSEDLYNTFAGFLRS